ncbi:MAG: hypothetical protein H7177_04550, partial [Rhizobacter sp.]|nr:hypothetical protein [Bacteriovorax sp.]
MKNILLIFFLTTLASCALFSPNPNRESILSTAPVELKPFTTDYCSDWPNGTSDAPYKWGNCCFTHDLHYWIGGTESERKDADKELKACVKNAG